MTAICTINNTDLFKINFLQIINKSLPGKEAQRKMAPPLRSLDPEPGITPRPSAVLIPLLADQEQLSVILTVRQSSLNHHSSEISFPGGASEPDDANLVQTALREADEEIALTKESIEITGALTPLYIPPSHYLVHPVVGWISKKPRLRANPAEVDRILEVPIELLLKPETIQQQVWVHEGKQKTAPCYKVDGHCIWGATAMILSELLTLICRATEGTEK